MSKYREEIVRLMAKAMHAEEYTSPYEELFEATRHNLEAQADAALQALEDADLIDRIP